MKRILFLIGVGIVTLVLLYTYDSKVKVEFIVDGEVYQDIKVSVDELVERPQDPEVEGYIFEGWYSEVDGEELFDFSKPITEETSIYAKFSVYDPSRNPEVTIIVEDYGMMVIELFPNIAPNTVNNFIHNVNEGVYTNNEFHRIIENFVIQGGAYSGNACVIEAEVNNNPSFEGENNLSHLRGTISMARTNVYNSATTQFFIVHQNATYLNNEYAAFGIVIEGLDVLDDIAGVVTNIYDQPINDVIITSISVNTFGVTYDQPVCE